jgi:putative flippase GtrA
MKNIFTKIGKWIRTIVDFFYPPFRKYMTPQFFRYGVTGVANMAFDWVLYFLTFHFLLEKQMLHIGFVTFSSHIAAMLIVFPITFITGFLLQKYVTFSASDIKGRIQIVRYLSVVIANLLLNYIGLKLLVDMAGFFPTPSKMIVTSFSTMFSYFSQKKYTFKLSKSSSEQVK